ncbi:DUF4296 domain-containing protein [Flavobacterium sp. RSB2_4_14]|uniref:DUF4296 domain-containing protein n=1 Tax=Flavobacterium sp. RSB2_4_14 TaxID=3447665 RepID=UPI003F3F1BA1
MRKILILLCLLFSLLSCDNNAIKKPKKLIEKDKMISILYDLSLVEAIKNQNINGGFSSKSANEYIYKKYKIDSIQLVESNKYYASDVDEYKKMFEVVKARLNNETLKIDAKLKQSGQTVPQNPSPQPISDTPQVQ